MLSGLEKRPQEGEEGSVEATIPVSKCLKHSSY